MLGGYLVLLKKKSTHLYEQQMAVCFKLPSQRKKGFWLGTFNYIYRALIIYDFPVSYVDFHLKRCVCKLESIKLRTVGDPLYPTLTVNSIVNF